MQRGGDNFRAHVPCILHAPISRCSHNFIGPVFPRTMPLLIAAGASLQHNNRVRFFWFGHLTLCCINSLQWQRVAMFALSPIMTALSERNIFMTSQPVLWDSFFKFSGARIKSHINAVSWFPCVREYVTKLPPFARFDGRVVVVSKR